MLLFCFHFWPVILLLMDYRQALFTVLNIFGVAFPDSCWQNICFQYGSGNLWNFHFAIYNQCECVQFHCILCHNSHPDRNCWLRHGSRPFGFLLSALNYFWNAVRSLSWWSQRKWKVSHVFHTSEMHNIHNIGKSLKIEWFTVKRT